MKYLISFSISLILFSEIVFSQIGGNNTYQFLNLPYSARIAALGGNFSSVKDDDLSLASSNPSLISDKINNNLSISYIYYFSNIKYGYSAFAHSFKKIGTFVGSIQFIDYGTFTYADATGQTYGSFKANEYAFNVGWGRNLDSNFSIGANLKLINSSLENYSSFGFAVDIASTYYNPKSRFSSSLIFRNVGRQLSYYTNSNSENLPFEIILAFSKQLQHAPFRFSVLLNHLEKWNLRYEDPLNPSTKTDPLTGEKTTKSELSKFGDNLLRHTVFGVEFIPSKSFNLRLGYNYQRRQEMKVESALSTVGFSLGFGIRVSKFYLSYANVMQHLAGSSNFITITTDLNKF